MMTRFSIALLTLLLVTPAQAQYSDYRNQYDGLGGRLGSFPDRNRTWAPADDFSADYLSGGNGYGEASDYRSYRPMLNNAVEDSYRRPVNYLSGLERSNYERPVRNERMPYGSRRGVEDQIRDPFRLPSYDDRRPAPYTPVRSRGNDDCGYEASYGVRAPLTRDRIPSRYDFSGESTRYDSRGRRDQDLFRTPASIPVEQNRYRPSREIDNRYEPLTPPLPRRESGSEAEAIYKAISARYGNPVNVRAVKSISATQALQMFREVNQQIDQRHLDPSSYDLRVRRGLRSLGLALENPAFVRAFGMTGDSFRVDGFRDALQRMATNLRVSGVQDSENVVRTVMQEAQNVPGLPASVVAFEFANASVDTLDKFSALEPRDPNRGASLNLTELKKAALESEIVGVGVELKHHEDGLLVMKALRGGPAAEAGLQPGDIVVGIDGRDIRGMAMNQSVDLMKGSAGSRLQLAIVRNSSRPANVSLTRRRVRIYTVNDMKVLPNTDKVAYISLSQFGQKSTEELDEALRQLYGTGMKSLILDLRGNPGGLLNVCVDITNRFLPCGTIVSTRGRLPSDNTQESATFSRTWSTPLVVLIDKDSASASEIFAAAVQDNQRGIVVGQRSYGKGTVQTHFPMSAVPGNLRLTTARFYSPAGRAMSGSGVTPDVKIADADGPANGDRVLEEAVRIAQSQRLRDIAANARTCRPRTGEAPSPSRSTFKDNMFDVLPLTVLR